MDTHQQSLSEGLPTNVSLEEGLNLIARRIIEREFGTSDWAAQTLMRWTASDAQLTVGEVSAAIHTFITVAEYNPEMAKMEMAAKMLLAIEPAVRITRELPREVVDRYKACLKRHR